MSVKLPAPSSRRPSEVILPDVWVVPPTVVFSVIIPVPWAARLPLRARVPAEIVSVMFPSPPRVRRPVPETVSVSVSVMKMSPDVLFVAERVPMVVSILPEPETPIPVAAESVAVPDEVMLAVSAEVMSVMLPAVAVSPMVLLVVVISARTMFVAAVSATVPEPVE